MITKNTFKKHHGNILIGLAVATAALSSYAQAKNESAMPLTYVSSKAIENNPEVQEAWHAFKSSIYGVDAARSGYLPSVTANAGGNYSIVDNRVTLTDGQVFNIDDINSVGYNANINLDYTLFNGLGRFYNVKKFKEQHQLSELQTKFVIENTLLQVYTQYYTVAQQYETINNLKETLKISSNRL